MEYTASKHVYRVKGLTCANCAAKFEKNVKELPRVVDAQVNFGASKITVFGEATVEELEKAGAFENIKVVPEGHDGEEEAIPFWKKRENQQLFVSFLFLIGGFLASYHYGEKSLNAILLYAVSIVIGGANLLLQGIKNFVRFEFDMRTLMTIAIIGAGAIGEWSEGATVVILFAISELLETYSMERARKSIRSLMELAPKEALVRRDGMELLLPVEEMRIGDLLIVKPGQKIAMDGIVVKGSSFVNQSAITGESIPVTKTVGDEVFAGSLNGEGYLEVEITKRVEDTTLSRIIYLVEEAQAGRAPSQAFVDRFAKYYTPVILVLGILIAIVPPLFFGGEWNDWIYRGLALLVVGCPCALVISTPVAIVTAIGSAARNGVLIKGGIHLEEAGSLSTIAFDKTGTLTKGIPEVTDFYSLVPEQAETNLKIAASIEVHSQHPLASAIVRKAEKEGIGLLEAAEFTSITGKGVKANVNGTTYYAGSTALFSEILPTGIEQEIQGQIQKWQQEGKTVILLGTSDQILALFAIRDELRPESKQVIEKLHQIGIKKTVMLTGDHNITAQAIGNQLGIKEIEAELLPEEKLQKIKELQQSGTKVAMVGDGINDAPALATATVGIAMGGAGTDTAMETADIVLMGDDLRKLPFTIQLSRRTLRVIKQNIAFSLAIKLLALLLIIPGWLTLWLAVFADMGATLIVTLNALRLLRVKSHLLD